MASSENRLPMDGVGNDVGGGGSRPTSPVRTRRPGDTFEETHSTSPVDLVSWVVGGMDLAQVRSVVDLGCGRGRFALAVARALGPDGAVHAVDNNQRYLDELDRRAQDAGLEIETINADILDELAIPEGSADLVMLNFVLNLMRGPRLDRCIDRAVRLMHPDGVLHVTAYGRHHMADVYDWMTEALILVGLPPEDATRRTRRMAAAVPQFTLGVGPERLRQHFDRVALDQFHDVLEVTPNEVDVLLGERTYGSPRFARDLPDGTSIVEIGEAFRGVMRSRTVNGLLPLRCDIGTLTATGRIDLD